MERTREEWLEELNWAYENGEMKYANEVRGVLGMDPIDKGGSPMNVRAAVGASKGPEAQLAAAQNFDPDAVAFGNDNFLINDQLYNPEGLDWGDVAEWGRPIAETAGALIGGTMGAGGGIPTGPGAIATAMAGAGVGGEIAGQLYDRGMDLFGREDTRSIEERVEDSAVDIAFNSMGGPGPKNPKHYIDMVGEMFQPKNKAIQEVSRRGGFLTAGQTGSDRAARWEGALEGDPFAGNIIDRQRDETRGIFADIIDEATPNATSREVSGQAAVDGMEFEIAHGRAKVSDAYRDFDKVLETAGGDRLSRISMRALRNASSEYKKLMSRDPGFAEMVNQDPDLRAAMDAIDTMTENAARNRADPSLGLVEQPTYEVIKQLRSMIGNKVNDSFYQGGEKVGLKRLYGILTDDLDEGAREIGGEAAVHARKRADELNTSLQRDLKSIDPVFKHAENPTQVYKTIATALEANPQLAAKARVAMGAEQWSRFVDSWIKNAATTKPGQTIIGDEVSSNTFLTNMQRLRQQSPEGYKLLVDGKEDIMDIAQELASMMRHGDQYINRSRTGMTMGAQQLASEGVSTLLGGTTGLLFGGGNPVPAVVGAGIATGLRVGIPKLVAKAMTSKSMAKALRAVKGKYGDNLPIGADLVRALVAAGATQEEVKEIME